MRELNQDQLNQVSGGVLLAVSGPDTYELAISQSGFFFYSNYSTGDTYIFGDNGKAMFIGILMNSYPLDFPFYINNDQLCIYTLPSSLFNVNA